MSYTLTPRAWCDNLRADRGAPVFLELSVTWAPSARPDTLASRSFVLRRFFIKHRSRLARLIAACGLLTVGLSLSRGLPHPLDIEVVLGPQHRDVVYVRIEYRKGRDALQGVSLSFPDGAPARVRHTVSLPGGDFEIRTLAHTRDGVSRSKVDALHTPADGTVVIRMPQEPAR